MSMSDPLRILFNPLRKIAQKIRVRSPEGSRIVKEVSEETVSGSSGSVDTYITETVHNLDCGCCDEPAGVCDLCHAVVCKGCFHHCFSCGRALCNQCTKWHEDKPFCEECRFFKRLSSGSIWLLNRIFGKGRKDR